MTRYHCLKCGELAEARNPFPWTNGTAYTHTVSGCDGRAIPIATLCSEPTVIDESDLAPGMVGVIKSEGSGLTWVVQTGGVTVNNVGLIDGDLADINVAGQILEVAGDAC